MRVLPGKLTLIISLDCDIIKSNKCPLTDYLATQNKLKLSYNNLYLTLKRPDLFCWHESTKLVESVCDICDICIKNKNAKGR